MFLLHAHYSRSIRSLAWLEVDFERAGSACGFLQQIEVCAEVVAVNEHGWPVMILVDQVAQLVCLFDHFANFSIGDCIAAFVIHRFDTLRCQCRKEIGDKGIQVDTVGLDVAMPSHGAFQSTHCMGGFDLQTSEGPQLCSVVCPSVVARAIYYDDGTWTLGLLLGCCEVDWRCGSRKFEFGCVLNNLVAASTFPFYAVVQRIVAFEVLRFEAGSACLTFHCFGWI